MTLLRVAFLLLLVPFAAAAQDDRGFLQGLIEDNLSSAGREVRIIGFEGALSSRATLEELTIADDDGVWLTLRGAVLDWNRSALLRGRLEVTTLSADELIVPRMPVTETAAVPTAEASGFALPDLPVSIRIDNLAIGRAELGAALFGAEAAISLDGSVSLDDGAGKAVLKVARVDGKVGELALDASFDNATQDLSLDLTVTEEPDGLVVNLLNLPGKPSVDLGIDGTGTLSDFKADIRLDTDGQTRLAGAITLTAEPRGEGPPLRRFSADIGGDLAPLFTPQYRPFFGDNIQLVASGARRPDGAMNLEQLTLTADSLMLEGQVALAPDGLPVTLSLVGQIADPAGGPVLLPVGASPIKVARVDLDVSFDAATDETWIATVGLIGLDTAGLRAKNLTLSGTGQIRSDAANGNRVTAKLDFMGQGLDLGSAQMTEALGTEIGGQADIDWQQGTPVKISALSIKGAGVDLTGSGTLDVEGSDLAITGTAAAEVAALAPFSGLAGRDLAGAVSARVSGTGALLGGNFKVDLSLRGQDLKVSIPQVDPLLRGQSTVELVAERDETGLRIDRLAVQSPEVTGSLTGKLQTKGSTLQAQADLREVSLVLPQLSGPLKFTASAQQNAQAWQIKADATGPGAAAIALEGALRNVMTAPIFDGTVNADISNLAAYAALAGRELAGAIEARLTGSAALSGKTFDVELNGTTRNLKTGIAQADAVLAGEATLALDAARDANGILLRRLDVDSPELMGTFSGSLQDQGSTLRAKTRLRDVALILPQLSGPVDLDADARQEGDDWQVRANIIGPGADISLDGTVLSAKTSPVYDGQISADIANLAAFAELAGRDLGGAIKAQAVGRAALNGETFDLNLTATSRDLKTGVPQADGLLRGEATVTANAARDATGITLRKLDVQSPELTGTFSGKLQDQGSSIQANARLRDVSLLLPKLKGAVTLAGTAQQSDGDWMIDAKATGPGASTVTLDGTLSDISSAPAFAGQATADIGDLGVYSALAGRDLGGSIVAQFTGSGALSGQTFDIDLSATTNNLRTGQPQADALLAGQATVDVVAARNETGIRVERLNIRSPELTATGAGTLKDRGSEFQLNAQVRETSRLYPQMSGPLSVNINAVDSQGILQIDAKASGPGSSDITVVGLITDPLSAPAFDGTVTAAVGDLGQFSQLAGRRLSGAVDLRATGQVASDNVSYALDISGSSTGLGIGQPEADKLLAGSVRFDATVSGEGRKIVVKKLIVDAPQLNANVSGSTSDGATDLTFDIRLANLGLFAPGIDGPLQTTGTASQTSTNGTWTVDLNAAGPAGSRARIVGSVAADFAQANIDISGQAPLALANRFITPNSVTGTANFNLSLNGRPSLSALSGNVSVAQGRAVLIGAGIVLNDISANIVLSAARANLSANAAVQNGGRISIDGPVALDAPFNANLVIRLAGVVVTDPDLYKTIVDGQLTATGPLAGGAALAGTLNLGRTEVQIPSTGLGGLGDIPDITHLHEPADVRATRARAGLLGGKDKDVGGTGPRYPIDVRIVASNQIFIRGRGLDAELGGTLRLTGTTADLVPSGRFDLVRGRLDILGKRLNLEEGFARLQGAFVPFIRLVATSDDGDVRILITIEGEANNPTISFTSQPESPEDEVLARLLFGRNIDQISPLQAAQLANAVATLAGRGGVGIIGRLREGFGLDDLDVTTDAEGNAALRAGKYIGENIYTDITIGTGTSEINLNLDISRTVTAKGTLSSTGETSLGIFFERDY